MHLWGAAELLREFRYLWPAGDCNGLGVGSVHYFAAAPD